MFCATWITSAGNWQKVVRSDAKTAPTPDRGEGAARPKKATERNRLSRALINRGFTRESRPFPKIARSVGEFGQSSRTTANFNSHVIFLLPFIKRERFSVVRGIIPLHIIFFCLALTLRLAI
jgi:hypothetical protein